MITVLDSDILVTGNRKMALVENKKAEVGGLSILKVMFWLLLKKKQHLFGQSFSKICVFFLKIYVASCSYQLIDRKQKSHCH